MTFTTILNPLLECPYEFTWSFTLHIKKVCSSSKFQWVMGLLIFHKDEKMSTCTLWEKRKYITISLWTLINYVIWYFSGLRESNDLGTIRNFHCLENPDIWILVSQECLWRGQSKEVLKEGIEGNNLPFSDCKRDSLNDWMNRPINIL